MFDKLIRAHIKHIKPYSSARDEFFGEAEIYLDANENPYEFPYHRYPDPYQRLLKKEIGLSKGINPANLFLGNGSDEVIDLLYRAFCEPQRDSVLAMSPSYGMYRVSADVNAVTFRTSILAPDFQLNADEFIEQIKQTDKLVFLCSPNNPSGNTIPLGDIRKIANRFYGIVVLDEAYIDFSEKPSAIHLLAEIQNLVILQTFSKAYASAGLRLGLGIMHEELVGILNIIKPPYNISQAAQNEAFEILRAPEKLKECIASIKEERTKLYTLLKDYSFIEHVFPSEGNFLLVRTPECRKLFQFLQDRGIIVRDRSKLPLCENCLRISIGTPEENIRLLEALKQFK